MRELSLARTARLLRRPSRIRKARCRVRGLPPPLRLASRATSRGRNAQGPNGSSPAKRGRGTMRSMVEGACEQARRTPALRPKKFFAQALTCSLFVPTCKDCRTGPLSGRGVAYGDLLQIPCRSSNRPQTAARRACRFPDKPRQIPCSERTSKPPGRGSAQRQRSRVCCKSRCKCSKKRRCSWPLAPPPRAAKLTL
jgi:hypothetical protein